MDLQSLNLFLSLADTLHFGRASRRGQPEPLGLQPRHPAPGGGAGAEAVQPRQPHGGAHPGGPAFPALRPRSPGGLGAARPDLGRRGSLACRGNHRLLLGGRLLHGAGRPVPGLSPALPGRAHPPPDRGPRRRAAAPPGRAGGPRRWPPGRRACPAPWSSRP